METCYLVTPTAALPGVVPVVPRYPKRHRHEFPV